MLQRSPTALITPPVPASRYCSSSGVRYGSMWGSKLNLKAKLKVVHLFIASNDQSRTFNPVLTWGRAGVKLGSGSGHLGSTCTALP
jgi:hypothetical protein